MAASNCGCSASICARNCSGVVPFGSMPSAVSCATLAGSRAAAITCLASLSIICGGVLAGTRRPFQLASEKSRYVSPIVGTLGSCLIRCGVANREDRQLAAFSLRHEIRCIAEKHVNLPAQQSRCHLATAAEWNMDRIESGARSEQCSGEMRNRAGAARSVIDLARLRIGEELGERPRRNGRVDSKD